jgi:hypothetical protein
MPTVQTFTLTPHPAMACASVLRITGQVSRMRGGLQLRFLLEGAMDHVRVPEPREPRFADELWRHTCFELFTACKGDTRYQEFNFSPSGEWAAYAFARYRERVPLPAHVDHGVLAPRVSVCRSAGRLQLDAVAQLDHLAPEESGAGLVLAVSAVVETDDGSLSYWALRHCAAKPDFHHPDAFVMELDEIRN